MRPLQPPDDIRLRLPVTVSGDIPDVGPMLARLVFGASGTDIEFRGVYGVPEGPYDDDLHGQTAAALRWAIEAMEVDPARIVYIEAFRTDPLPLVEGEVGS